MLLKYIWESYYKQHEKILLVSNSQNIAFFTQIDECGRMWVLDSGRLNEVNICNAQILVFDLKTVS